MKSKGLMVFVLSLLFIPMVSANLITNPSFEYNTDGDIYHCCDNIITGCSYSTTTGLLPDDWESNHLAQTLMYPHDGYYSSVIISEWPNNCSYLGASTCGALNETNYGYVKQNIYNVSNTSLGLSFYIKECDSYPEDCGGFWSATKYFGNNSLDIFNYYQVLLQFQEASGSWTNFSYVGYAPETFAYPEYLDISSVEGINHSLTDFNMSITFLNPILIAYDEHQYCFILDDVELDYVITPPHFANDYISDMNTFVSMGYTNLYLWGWNIFDGFKTSVGFDGESLGYISGQVDLGNYNCTDTPVIMGTAITYNDDSVLYINGSYPISTDNFYFDYYSGGHNYWNFSYTFPLLDYSNIENVTLSFKFDQECGAGTSWFPFYFFFEPNTAYMSVREVYDNELLTPSAWEINENLYGNNSLYPIIMFNGSVSGNNFLFTSYNFMGVADSSGSNFELRQFREDGIIKNIYAGSETFGTGRTHHTISGIVIDYDADDYFIAYYFMGANHIPNYSSNGTTIFGSPEATGCETYCDGTTLVVRELIAAYNLCIVTERIENSYLCVEEEEPGFFSDVGESVNTFLGFQTDSYSTGTEKANMFLGIIIALAVSFGIGGYFKSGLLVGMCMPPMFLLVTFIGLLPPWVGILLIIISGFIAVKWLGQIAPGSEKS